MKTDAERRQYQAPHRASPGLSLWWLLIVFFISESVSVRADDVTKVVEPIKPEVPVKVVFLYMGGAEPVERPNNTKIIGWTKGLTVQGAIIAAGGISIPPRPKVKLVRGLIEIHFRFWDMAHGELNVQLEPGDKVVLCLPEARIPF